MTLKYIWRSFQPRLSFPHPFQLSLACFRVARSPSSSWACWFRPPNAKNFLPKIFKKSSISRLVSQIDGRCLGLPGRGEGFGDGRFNGTVQNFVGPTLHGNEIWARRGDPVAYRLLLSICQSNQSYVASYYFRNKSEPYSPTETCLHFYRATLCVARSLWS